MPLPIIPSRCGWCHDRETIIDRNADRLPWWVFRLILRWDILWRGPAIRWHNRHHGDNIYSG